MWSFFIHQPGRTLVDPIEEAFFSTDSDEENARHLVRESIQNSLDARHSNQPVRVRFTFGQLEQEFVAELFDGLPEHLQAKGSGLQSPPSVKHRIRFLAIEDFGTSGLVGKPDQLQDRDTGDEDNFFFFWRNVGRSGKRGRNALGKWGLGKTVFPASSRINTFFGLTRRHEDSTSYLLGRCDIKTHHIADSQFDPYGYYALWEGQKPLAICDPGRIKRFKDAFHLARKGNEDVPGLSIIIPHIIDEFNVKMLKQEVIENYFWPILKGDLVIEVQENYLTPPETKMDAEWMRSEVQRPMFKSNDQELADTIELAAWAADKPRIQAHVEQHSKSTPKWDDVDIRDTDLTQLIESDRNEEPFLVRVPVWIRRSFGDPVPSWFDIYGKSVPYKTRRKSYLVREGINIGLECKTNPSQRVFFIVIEKGALANMMGAAENPSHTRFQLTNSIKQDYRRGAMKTIGFVTTAPIAISRMLDAKDEDTVATLFSDIFWKVPAPTDPPKSRPRQRVPLGKTEGPKVEVDRRIAPFFLTRINDGFQVADNAERNRGIESITIKAGFEGGRGDPIKQHSKFDFDFMDESVSGLNLDASGCQIERVGSNEIKLLEIEKGFSFRISGFDTRRDLTVRATPKLVKS